MSRYSAVHRVALLSLVLGVTGCGDATLPPLDQYSNSISGRVTRVEADRKLPHVYVAQAVWTPSGTSVDEFIIEVNGDLEIYFTQSDGSVRKKSAKDIPVGATVTAYTQGTGMVFTLPPILSPLVVTVAN